MNHFERLEVDNWIGSGVIVLVNLIFSQVILAVDGVRVGENILAQWLVAGMAFWCIMAYCRLRGWPRAAFVQAAKQRLLAQWGGQLLIITVVVCWFATLFHYPGEHVAASPLVSFYRDQAMPWQYPLVILMIFIPFTIGYPLAILIVNKVMKKEVGK